tara:strand:+ start:221 stop:700 length:480 start_codon:yes stop_codon:yes gene_type:complete
VSEDALDHAVPASPSEIERLLSYDGERAAEVPTELSILVSRFGLAEPKRSWLLDAVWGAACGDTWGEIGEAAGRSRERVRQRASEGMARLVRSTMPAEQWVWVEWAAARARWQVLGWSWPPHRWASGEPAQWPYPMPHASVEAVHTRWPQVKTALREAS